MSVGMSTEGLSLEQAPPLSIPLSFFFVAPLALAVAGFLIVVGGEALLASRWVPQTMTLAHLGTLGFLAAVMLGALYQMTPVVAGRPVPVIRLAHAVQLGLICGVVALGWGLASGGPAALRAATYLLAATMLTFVVPVGVALFRAATATAAVGGMRLAVLGLVAVVVLGLWLAAGRGAIVVVPGDPIVWLRAHIAFGLVVWVGGLITGVSWQVIPMFYLTAEFPRWSQRLTLAAIGLSFVGLLGALLARLNPAAVAVAALPGALAVGVLHPLLALRLIARRRRRRPDASLTFWRLGLCCAPAALLVGAAGAVLDDPRWPVLFAWLAIWGWAGMIVHGMLSRIIAFLIWFHRFSALVGKAPVPPMRRLLPDYQVRIDFWLHLSTLAVGALAIVANSATVARIVGLGLLFSATALAAALLRPLLHRAR